MTNTPDVTALLREISSGNDEAQDALFPLIYDHLHRLARIQRSRGAAETLNTTALVHEAYLKLVRQDDSSWESRAHFFGVAAKAMRHIAINYARAQRRQKRGGDQQPVPLDEAVVLQPQRADELVALDEALDLLAEEHPRQAQVVELRFFGGLTIDETAEVLGVSAPTVKRDWRMCRTWLYARVRGILHP